MKTNKDHIKTIIVMGNGPSLKDVDFSSLKGYDTFGLNSAYRAYQKMNWYPTYHGCFDYVVTESHKDSFKNFVENSPSVKRFFYLQQISDDARVKKIKLLPYGTSSKFNQKESDFDEFNDNGNSGANACSASICLGYKKIILLGVDCNYVDFVEGSKKQGSSLVIEKTPETNPNYWFDDYQQQGDEYNVPQAQIFHTPAWNSFANKAADAGIEVVNCSPISTLNCFRKSTLGEEIS